MKPLRVLTTVCILCTVCGSAVGQYGGRRHLFAFGVGARALSLGGAYVADPQDPSAVFWNPGGVDFLERKSVTVFYASLFEGTRLEHVGYVHPTRNFGSFGFGFLRIGSGDAQGRGTHNEPEGTFSFEQQEFLISYSKQVFSFLSLGFNAKMERQQHVGFTSNGLGGDIGLLYKPSFSGALFRGLSVGLSVSNAVQPHLRLAKENEEIGERETMPYTLRFGIAKPIRFGDYGNAAMLYFDVDKGQAIPLKFHIGAEYMFREMAMLRVGMNNGTLAFGAGAAYGSFQIDYSFGWLEDAELPPSHRVSVTFSFGLTKREMIALAEQKRTEELEEEMRARRDWERRDIIVKGLQKGEEAYEAADYYTAFTEFTRVVSVEDTVGLDPDLIDARQSAREKLRLTELRLQEARDEIAARDAREQQAREKQSRIDEHFRKATAFLAQDEFAAAIREFDRILEENPDHEQAIDFRERASQDQRDKVQALIQRAEREASKPTGANEAIRIYGEAERLAGGQEDLTTLIQGRVSGLTQELDFENAFRQGLEEERAGDYEAAVRAFQRALGLQPGNAAARRHYQDALARASAKNVEPTGEARKLYREGYQMYRQGKYREALEKFEEANRMQPHTLRILQGMDAAKGQIAKAQGGQK